MGMLLTLKLNREKFPLYTALIVMILGHPTVYLFRWSLILKVLTLKVQMEVPSLVWSYQMLLQLALLLLLSQYRTQVFCFLKILMRIPLDRMSSVFNMLSKWNKKCVRLGAGTCYSFVIQAEAKVVADDLGAAHLLNNIDFKTATTEDMESFKSGLNSERLTHGNADWTVKLGVNLFHSAELGRSTNYSKQIPDNSVLYKAFGHGPSADISAKTKLVQKRSVVAGKLCGKVCMSHQVHDLLAEGVHDEQYLSQTLAKQQVPEPEVMPENPKKRQTVDFSSESSKFALKRKRMADTEPTSRIEYPEIVESVKDAPRGKCDIQYQRRHKLKKKVTLEKSLLPEKDRDQGRQQFDVNMEEKLEEGGPSTRLRPRKGKQPTKDPELVMDKAVERSASKELACAERAKRTRAIQASSVKRTKKSDEAEYSCNIEGCAMNFGSKQELVLHYKNICSVEGCGKKFVSHKYLLQHHKVHLDDRPLKCSWVGCSKTFKWAWARTEHLRVHTGARPYACGETGCGKTFRFVSDFSRHKRNTGHSRKIEESAKKRKKKTK